MKESCQLILSEISPKLDDKDIEFKMKAYKEDLLKMFSVLQPKYAKTKLKALEIYGSSINGLQIAGSSDLDLTILVDDPNASHEEILFTTGQLIQSMSDEGEFPNIKVENQKSHKRLFGDILDFTIVSKKNPELKVSASMGINKVLGLTNSMMLNTYC